MKKKKKSGSYRYEVVKRISTIFNSTELDKLSNERENMRVFSVGQVMIPCVPEV